MKNKGDKPHYKDDPKGTKSKKEPKKKAKYKDESIKPSYSFREYCALREEEEQSLLAKVMAGAPGKFEPGTRLAPRGDCPHCESPKRDGEQLHSVDCPLHGDWVRARIAKRRAAKGG
jgi:hypothetical protein